MGLLFFFVDPKISYIKFLTDNGIQNACILELVRIFRRTRERERERERLINMDIQKSGSETRCI